MKGVHIMYDEIHFQAALASIEADLIRHKNEKLDDARLLNVVNGLLAFQTLYNEVRQTNKTEEGSILLKNDVYYTVNYQPDLQMFVVVKNQMYSNFLCRDEGSKVWESFENAQKEANQENRKMLF